MINSWHCFHIWLQLLVWMFYISILLPVSPPKLLGKHNIGLGVLRRTWTTTAAKPLAENSVFLVNPTTMRAVGPRAEILLEFTVNPTTMTAVGPWAENILRVHGQPNYYDSSRVPGWKGHSDHRRQSIAKIRSQNINGWKFNGEKVICWKSVGMYLYSVSADRSLQYQADLSHLTREWPKHHFWLIFVQFMHIMHT